jgi:hypothetical protein
MRGDSLLCAILQTREGYFIRLNADEMRQAADHFEAKNQIPETS